MRRLSEYLDPNRSSPLSVSAPAIRHKSDKGAFNGSCNREACQKPGAIWFNRSTLAYYCGDCAHLLNRSNRDWTARDGGGPLCAVVTPEQAKAL